MNQEIWRRFKEKITAPVITSIGEKLIDPKFSKSPIFIGGCARSGTTLLLAILSACPVVLAIPEETDAFTSWNKNNQKPVRLDRFYRKLFKHHIPKIKKRWAEKRPDNVHFIEEIINYFGSNSRFIHIIRDPRAVCCSIHPAHPSQYWVQPDRWVDSVTAGLKFKNHPQVLTLKYEDLVQSNSQTVRSICDFINEPYTDQMKNWEIHATLRDSNAWKKSLSSIHQQSIDQWKQEQHQDRVREVLKNQKLFQLMSELGYN